MSCNSDVTLTCPLHWHWKAHQELLGNNLSSLLRVESFENIVYDNISITPEHESNLKWSNKFRILWEDSLDHIHQLGLTDFSLRKVYSEAIPQSHDVKLCELIILNRVIQNVDWSTNVRYPSHHFLHIHRLLALHRFFPLFLRLLSHCARTFWLLLQGYGADKISEMSQSCQMFFSFQLKPEVGRHIFQRIAFLLFLLFLFVLIIHDILGQDHANLCQAENKAVLVTW